MQSPHRPRGFPPRGADYSKRSQKSLPVPPERRGAGGRGGSLLSLAILRFVPFLPSLIQGVPKKNALSEFASISICWSLPSHQIKTMVAGNWPVAAYGSRFWKCVFWDTLYRVVCLIVPPHFHYQNHKQVPANQRFLLKKLASWLRIWCSSSFLYWKWGGTVKRTSYTISELFLLDPNQEILSGQQRKSLAHTSHTGLETPPGTSLGYLLGYLVTCPGAMGTFQDPSRYVTKNFHIKVPVWDPSSSSENFRTLPLVKSESFHPIDLSHFTSFLSYFV